MDPLALHTVAEYSRGTLHRGDGARTITAVATDTRSLAVGDLFLALVGDHFDGHEFIAQAAAAGAAGAVVSRAIGASVGDGNFALIEVDDTLLAYQRLAAAYRRNLPLRMVAITGSNGKTSTKDFTAAVLGRGFRVLKTEGNFNNHIGVPRTLLRASRQDEVAVLEIGMNHPGEIRPLAEMVRPDVAIITNIGTAHIEYMGSREAIAQEKGVLVESVGSAGHVILPAEDPFCGSLARRTQAKVITAGSRKGDLQAENVRVDIDGSRFDVRYGGARTPAMIAVPGAHMIVNTLLSLAAGVSLGLTLDEAVEGLQTAALTKGRLQLKSVGDLCVVDDSYNANPDSMSAALASLAALRTGGRRIAVLGRMGELGTHAEEGHRRVGAAAASAGFDYVVTVGDEAATIARGAADAGLLEAHPLDTLDEAARFLHATAHPDDLILIKGSRAAGMERIIPLLASLRGATMNSGGPTAHQRPNTG